MLVGVVRTDGIDGNETLIRDASTLPPASLAGDRWFRRASERRAATPQPRSAQLSPASLLRQSAVKFYCTFNAIAFVLMSVDYVTLRRLDVSAALFTL